MSRYHGHHGPPPQVREPVQVYLDAGDRDRLERLREQLGSNKSDVLRRGLEALERELTDPERHPALRIIGLAGGSGLPPRSDDDVAREHDRYLTDAEEMSWRDPQEGGRRGL